MTTARDIAESIHNTIDESTTAIEGIHHSIAELPLDILASVEPLEQVVTEVRDLQTRSIKGVYGIVRLVNDRIGEIAADVLDKSAVTPSN